MEIVIGKPVRGENFIGRQKEIKEISFKLKTGSSVTLSAPRRYGKTSLMFAIQDELTKSGILNIHIDLTRLFNPRELAEELISKTYQAFGFDGSIHRIKNLAADFFKNFLAHAQTFKLTSESTGIEFAAKLLSNAPGETNDEALLTFALGLSGTLAAKTGKKVVLSIDEFGEIDHFQSAKGELIKKMRSIFQTSPNISFLFAGSQTSIMNDIFNNENSSFYRFSDIYILKPIKKADYQEYFEKVLNEMKISYNGKIENLNEHIYNLSNGVPFYSMAVFKETLSAAVIADVKTINDFSINKAFIAFYNSQKGYFEQQLNSLKGKKYQSILLAAIVTDSSPYPVMAEYGVAAGNVKKELERIEQTGLISYKNTRISKYVITDPLLHRFIEKNLTSVKLFKDREVEKESDLVNDAMNWIRQQHAEREANKSNNSTEKTIEKPGTTLRKR